MSWKEKAGWLFGAVLAVVFLHQVCNYDPAWESNRDREQQGITGEIE